MFEEVEEFPFSSHVNGMHMMCFKKCMKTLADVKTPTSSSPHVNDMHRMHEPHIIT